MDARKAPHVLVVVAALLVLCGCGKKPTADGPFYTILRSYGPEKEVLDGRWTPPVLRKAG